MSAETMAAIASIAAGVLTPAVGWLLAKVIGYGERITRMETQHEALESAIAKDVKALRDELRKHMDEEVRIMKEALRQVLAEQKGPIQ